MWAPVRHTESSLDMSGWGGFAMHANIVHGDRRETIVSHDVVLLYPDGKPTLA